MCLFVGEKKKEEKTELFSHLHLKIIDLGLQIKKTRFRLYYWIKVLGNIYFIFMDVKSLYGCQRNFFFQNR